MQTVKEHVESDPELKAYIYQHLADLQPYLAPESQVALLVDQDENESFSGHALTLIAIIGDHRLEAEGQSPNIYEAFLTAKEDMLMQLREWFLSVVDTSQRDGEIQAVIERRHFVH